MSATEQERQAEPTAPVEDGDVAAPAEGAEDAGAPLEGDELTEALAEDLAAEQAEEEILGEDAGEDQTEGGDDLGDDDEDEPDGEPEPAREGDEPPAADERTTEEILGELKAEGATFYVPPAESTDPAEAGNEAPEDEMSEDEARGIIGAFMSEGDGAPEGAPEATPEEQAIVANMSGNGTPPAPADAAKAEAKAKEQSRVAKSLPIMPMRRAVKTELVRGNHFTAAVVSVESPWEPGAERAMSFGITGDVTPEQLKALLEEWKVDSHHHLSHVRGRNWLGEYVVTGLVIPDEAAEGGARYEGTFPDVKVQLWAHGPAPTWTQPQAAPAPQPETPAKAGGNGEDESTGEKPALELVPAGAGGRGSAPRPRGDAKQQARQSRQAARQERKNRLRSSSDGNTGRA